MGNFKFNRCLFPKELSPIEAWFFYVDSEADLVSMTVCWDKDTG
jgi:hypothetical protein